VSVVRSVQTDQGRGGKSAETKATRSGEEVVIARAVRMWNLLDPDVRGFVIAAGLGVALTTLF
jgi:hypothetical protein